MEPQTLRKILIVEDDLSQKPLWSNVISRFSTSTEIEWVVSSEQAKKLIAESKTQLIPYDLIIVDMFLAGSDTGLDFLKSKEVLDMNTKTILVSAADKDSLELHMKRESGKTKVLIKPLNMEKCTQVLKEILH